MKQRVAVKAVRHGVAKFEKDGRSSFKTFLYTVTTNDGTKFHNMLIISELAKHHMCISGKNRRLNMLRGSIELVKTLKKQKEVVCRQSSSVSFVLVKHIPRGWTKQGFGFKYIDFQKFKIIIK